jgi:hypothetical protein
MEQMPRLGLGLALTVGALERELEWSASGKGFLSAHRQIGCTLETISCLKLIRALDMGELLEPRAVAADDVPRSQIRISRSPVTAGSIVVIHF